jgi:hypothetical protein
MRSVNGTKTYFLALLGLNKQVEIFRMEISLSHSLARKSQHE